MRLINRVLCQINARRMEFLCAAYNRVQLIYGILQYSNTYNSASFYKGIYRKEKVEKIEKLPGSCYVAARVQSHFHVIIYHDSSSPMFLVTNFECIS